jgi:5,10-methenyltetrahydrofolate synthetase
MSIFSEKKQVRAEIRAKRKALPLTEKSLSSRRICDYLLTELEKHPVGNLLSYIALKEEPDLMMAMKEAQKKGWGVYVPALTRDLTMIAAQYQEELEKTQLGFFQPKVVKAINSVDISLYWIPGVAFGSKGYRLGMGGGFYDRFLEKKTGTLVGVGWSFQMLNTIPRESHDIRMNLLVNEKGVLETFKRF